MPLESADQQAGKLGTFSSHVALLLLTASMAFRAVAAGRPPLGNLWEFTIAFGWGVVLFSVLFERSFGQRAVSAFVMPVAAIMMAVAIAFFPPEIKPLVPALQANRILAIHVSVMVLAYTAFSVSFGAAVIFLLQDFAGKRFQRLPDAETLEDIAYWSVLVGFPLLALGLALRSLLGALRLGTVLGMGSKRDVGLDDLVYLRRLSTRAQPRRLARSPLRVSSDHRVRRDPLYLFRRQFLDFRPTQLRRRLNLISAGRSCPGTCETRDETRG